MANTNGNNDGDEQTTATQPAANNHQAAAAADHDPVTLAPAELEILSEMDSSRFGFVQLAEEKHARKRKVALKAVLYLEQVLAAANGPSSGAAAASKNRKRKLEEANNNGKTVVNGDSHSPKEHGPVYLKLGHLHLLLEDFGKALSAYQKYRALCPESARQVLFLYGLGLVYFHFNAFHWAQQAFQQALYLEPAFERSSEIHIRLGIMAKVNHDYAASHKYFLMAQKSSSECFFSSQQIRYHVAHLHEVHRKYPLAIHQYKELLREAMANATPANATLRADVQRSLGWIYYSVDMGEDKLTRIQTAIQYLQRSIDLDPKSGQSLYLLGRCYASIGKVHEAFIAYRNSVDKSESNADTWCSIGVLYQQQNQPMDALQAYICAVQIEKHHTAAWTNLGILYESTAQLQDALTCYHNAVSKQKTPGANLHQRIKYLKAQLSGAPPPNVQQPPKQNRLPSVEDAWNLPVSNEMAGRQSSGAKGAKAANGTDAGADKRMKDGNKIVGLSQQQLQTLHYLQNQSHLHPQQHHLLQQLQQQFHLFKQQQLKQQQQQQQDLLQKQQQDNVFGGAGGTGNDGGNNADGELGGVSDKELEALLAQQDIGDFAESLLKEFQGENPLENDGKADGDDAAGAEDSKPKAGSKPEMQVNPMDILTDLRTEEAPERLELTQNMSGDEIVRRCKRWASNRLTLNFTVPNPFEVPRAPMRPKLSTSKDNLLPPTPSVYLENKKDASTPQLQEFCLQHPITVVRGIANALKLDLGLFATKALAETRPSQPIEIITQIKQNADENWDPVMQKQTWKSAATKSRSTIGKYSKYQTTSFQDQLKDEQEKPNSFNSSEIEASLREDRKKRRAHTSLQLCSRLDLVDQRVWRQQLAELSKLPSWARVVSSGNMLSHLGFHIQGMNTTQLKMKVPGARISGRQEGNNFCAININIGPGDCEWFAIPNEYWGTVNNLCEKNGVHFSRGSWWPNMKDLSDEGIPVYRFLQRPGDMVWVNSGCIYWVQSLGWCNNIFWNVGPMTTDQYKMAMQKYEWNRLQHIKSVIPMTMLSFNLARNVRMTNDPLHASIKDTLRKVMQKIILVSEYVKTQEISIKYHGRKKTEPAHSCAQCECEVFGYLFVRQEEGQAQPVILCFECALAVSRKLKTFVCLEEYTVKELVSVYDGFKLHTQAGAGSFAQPAAAAGSPGVSPHHSAMIPQHPGIGMNPGSSAGHHQMLGAYL